MFKLFLYILEHVQTKYFDGTLWPGFNEVANQMCQNLRADSKKSSTIVKEETKKLTNSISSTSIAATTPVIRTDCTPGQNCPPVSALSHTSSGAKPSITSVKTLSPPIGRKSPQVSHSNHSQSGNKSSITSMAPTDAPTAIAQESQVLHVNHTYSGNNSSTTKVETMSSAGTNLLLINPSTLKQKSPHGFQASHNSSDIEPVVNSMESLQGTQSNHSPCDTKSIISSTVTDPNISSNHVPSGENSTSKISLNQLKLPLHGQPPTNRVHSQYSHYQYDDRSQYTFNSQNPFNSMNFAPQQSMQYYSIDQNQRYEPPQQPLQYLSSDSITNHSSQYVPQQPMQQLPHQSFGQPPQQSFGQHQQFMHQPNRQSLDQWSPQSIEQQLQKSLQVHEASPGHQL